MKISIDKLCKLFNIDWRISVCYPMLEEKGLTYDSGYAEHIGLVYKINPLYGQVASSNIKVFDPKKAAAMYFWYEAADKTDKSILRYFPEYERCIDNKHTEFNSNYGVFAQSGLNLCIEALLADKNSRQACFMINNNDAMGPNSIDKLCTNAIMFFIRRDTLRMVIQMRSSNLLTLLPYDMFIFSTWYAKVYNALIKQYPNLGINSIIVQVASIHFFESDFEEKADGEENNCKALFTYKDMCDSNFKNVLEEKLIEFLKQ